VILRVHVFNRACFSHTQRIKFSMDNDKVCTLIINGDKKVQPTPIDIQKKIEAASSVYMQKKDPKKLVEALEELLLFMVNGNSYPKLLMTIIRFVITCDDHRVKKLLGLYWELCDKIKENGDLKEEMVLVWYGNLSMLIP
jgi:coatomer subunit beta